LLVPEGYYWIHCWKSLEAGNSFLAVLKRWWRYFLKCPNKKETHLALVPRFSICFCWLCDDENSSKKLSTSRKEEDRLELLPWEYHIAGIFHPDTRSAIIL
jgi:hypothetical protein